jgi:beta-glucosidase
MQEERDAPNLSLPDNQDALVAAVADANPHTIVVIESGGPVLMPWSENVSGILEAWYPGIGGAQALANILFGTVNPSGKLPATFPRTEADLPHPVLPGSTRVFPPNTGAGPRNNTKAFDVDYNIEGARVGYKWFDSENKQPLYPFGFGLSYTTFAYTNLSVDTQLTATFTVKNTGKSAGTEITQVYGQFGGENFKRLVGWQRVTLSPGESKTIHITADSRVLSSFDDATDTWHRSFGGTLYVGASSRNLPLTFGWR